MALKELGNGIRKGMGGLDKPPTFGKPAPPMSDFSTGAEKVAAPAGDGGADFSSIAKQFSTGLEGLMGMIGDGVDLPEPTLINYADLIKDLSPTAQNAASEATTAALGLANAQGEKNLAWIEKATGAALANTQTAYESLSNTVTNAAMSTLDSVDPSWRTRLADITASTNLTASSVSQFMVANLPSILESGRDIGEAHDKFTKSLLAGEIPDDVAAQVSRRSAETANQFGIFGGDAGGAGRAMEARDLGMTSLSMQRLGADQAGKRADIWSSSAAIIAAYDSTAQKSAGGLLALQKEMGLLDKPDVNAIYSQQQAAANAAGVIDPNRVFDSALGQYNNLMGWGVDVAKGNQQAQAQYDSMALQYRTDVLGAKVSLAGASISANASLGAAAIGARSTTDAARINADAVLGAAYADAGATVASAKINAGATVDSARISKSVFKQDKYDWTKDATGKSTFGVTEKSHFEMPG